jgi:hypothetical protein
VRVKTRLTRLRGILYGSCAMTQVTEVVSDTERLVRRHTIELEPGALGKTEVDFATKSRVDQVLAVCRTMQDKNGNRRRHYISARVALAIVREMFPRSNTSPS